ncbi:MAG: YgjV family protein [Lachnospiraceae bacterium]|nr:YgjV family protein [Lachnospiraceae bacterium]MBR4768874.1 YgjV family protein [Lachnospiraceae bacterium]
MTKEMIFEMIGYLGSLLVLVSMLMTSVVKLRVINLIGSAIFAAYALLIRSYPTALLNICLVAINVYQLIKLSRRKSGSYTVQPIGEGEGFASWFLKRYQNDITRYFPGTDLETGKDTTGFAVFFEAEPAGILLGRREEETFEILVDYTTPGYRDLSVGTFLYDELKQYGIRKLTCRVETPEHVGYMEKIGFRYDEETHCRVKEI